MSCCPEEPIHPATHPVEQHYLDLTRRRFFGLAARSVSAGVGGMALASLLGAGRVPDSGPRPATPGAGLGSLTATGRGRRSGGDRAEVRSAHRRRRVR